MLTAILFDDENLALNVFNIQLGKINKTKVLGQYLDCEKLIKGVEEYKPNIAFVDIETPNENGIEIAKNIKKISPKTEIVFVTAHKQYAYEAYELEAIDYLLKPIKRERLERVIDRIRNKMGKINPIENSFQVYTMSKFYIKNAQGEIVKWRTKKVEELMAFFIHNKGNALSSDIIIEGIWSEKDSEKAKRILYTSMYYLKKNLKEYNVDIRIDKKTYSILNENMIDDAVMIIGYMEDINKINEQSINKYNKVLSMYKGGYMEFNHYLWSNGKRLQIETKFIQLSKDVIRYYERNHDYSKMMAVLNKLLSINDYEEELYIQYMEACKKSNNDIEFNRINQKYKEIMGEI
ncbi:response regulator [Marinisporobacter balticus]|uniref:Stage 0 sporulation protein A homolog n=1 Tax=Marinisporobacter balticus TaxID=2018667 RepID=A0A4R2KGS1_9FIRM|nr:response regulator [Marinisporobacter balticus]TCO69666.1 two-component SAPR family response regulator [Marinisporobacter balticus]